MNDFAKGEFWVVDSDHSLKMFIDNITELYNEKKYLTIKWKAGRTRSSAQNNALHVYCRQLGDVLNDSGLDMKKVMKPTHDIKWTTSLVKEHLWKPMQKYVTDKESTTDALVGEYDLVHKHLSQLLSEKFGVYVPFPSRKE